MITFTLALLVAATNPESANAIADGIVQHDQIPAAGIALVRCESLDAAVSGITSNSHSLPTEALAESRFSLGSNAKSYLATAAAAIIDQGLARWDMTVAESGAFELNEDNPNYHVTLYELLTHTSGIASYSSGRDLDELVIDSESSVAPHIQFARLALESPSAGARGDYLYSNAGPVVAATILEHLTGLGWLDIIDLYVLEAWGVGAQLAAPVSDDPAHLFGHYAEDEGLAVYALEEPEIPPFLHPAGYLSVTIEEYARYLQRHLCGLQGFSSGGLSPTSVAELHAPAPGTQSAIGWAYGEVQGANWSYHVGTTGTHYAYAAINPELDRAFAVLVNSGTPQAGQAALSTLLDLME
ncbi:serine hydrolase [Maricaulis sp.]|uniref:serine hydrolase domain-containing protein n=1 Tax=Maricaulis sp. TaxID=1486257 RepID=UPI001B29575F|nr:serine hydrolase domain-containing protein [Maricaulis sp.]MBO6798469.1 beta-lactamase family protein [Maricaulis sp.]